jgi:hypothetical protein
MRRAAASLVERREERFESRHGIEESRTRLHAAFERAQLRPPLPFRQSWHEEGGHAVLVATFEPSRGVKRFLEITSLVFVMLMGSSAWVLLSAGEHGALRFLLPLTTALGVLGLPFVTLGIASARAATESRIRRAIGVALRDEEERFPPRQRWAEED